MKEITTRQDIELMVDSFYEKAIKDDLIGPVFTEVAKLDFEVHLPVMYDFWESILFDKVVYKGNPMIKHIDLSKKTTMDKARFDRWLELWDANISSQFEGLKAQEAIKRAKMMAELMQFKINQS